MNNILSLCSLHISITLLLLLLLLSIYHPRYDYKGGEWKSWRIGQWRLEWIIFTWHNNSFLIHLIKKSIKKDSILVRYITCLKGLYVNFTKFYCKPYWDHAILGSPYVNIPDLVNVWRKKMSYWSSIFKIIQTWMKRKMMKGSWLTKNSTST